MNHKCTFPEGMSMNIGGTSVSPCAFEEVGIYKNVTVQVLRCKHCGELSIGWYRQPDTEVLYEKGESYGTTASE